MHVNLAVLPDEFVELPLPLQMKVLRIGRENDLDVVGEGMPRWRTRLPMKIPLVAGPRSPKLQAMVF